MWRPGQANDLVPLKTDILLKLFRPGTGLAKLYEGAEKFLARGSLSLLAPYLYLTITVTS